MKTTRGCFTEICLATRIKKQSAPGRKFALSAVAWSMIAFSASLLHAQSSGSEQPSANGSDTQRQAASRTYLGVSVKPISPEVAAQLGDLLGKEQGLVVDHVTADSPAVRAGIQKYDILATYDDQKLFSVAQLMKLVRADKVGRKVSLGIIRAGKPMNLEFALGEWKPRLMSDRRRAMGANRRGARTAGSRTSRPKANWDRFESLSVQKTGAGRLKVTIRHRDDQGNVKQHDFEGTPTEISTAIQNDNSVPASATAYLPPDLYQPINIYQPTQPDVPLSPLTQTYTGYFVDAGNGAITIQESDFGSGVTFQLAPGAVITRNGQPASLQDFTATDMVTVTEEDTVVTKVSAKSVDPYSGCADRNFVPAYVRGLASAGERSITIPKHG
jgi:PDZ domain